MNFLFFTSDLHIPKHVDRYRQVFPVLSATARFQYVYFPLPLFVHLTADKPEYIQPIISKLGSISQLKTLNQIQDPLIDLHSNNISSLDPYVFIEDEVLTTIVSSVLHSDLSRLQGFVWRGLQVFNFVKRDVSLCLKSHVFDLSLLTNSFHIDFIRLSIIAAAISHEIVTNILQFCHSHSRKIDRCIIPDAYSAYNAVAAGAKLVGVQSMILTADPHFDSFLKILPVDINPLNLALHNAQHLVHEYASPEVYFGLSKLYLEQKVIKGSSFLAYSSAKSDHSEQNRINQFLSCHSKCLVYFTSSPDEQILTDHKYDSCSLQSGLISKGIDLFSDEFEMFSDLIQYSIHNGYGLIVRMHPRLGAEHRSTHVSSAREQFFRRLESLDDLSAKQILLINPEVQLSSYWLGAHASVNIFYRSSIGTELLMLGLPSISPQHLNSYTYQGNYYETSVAPTNKVAWHHQIDLVAQEGFSYYLHLAVRGFYIQRFASAFRVDSDVNPSKLSVYSNDNSSDFVGSLHPNEVSQFFTACSSFSLPQIKGYWSLSDYMPSWKSYMHWLLYTALPQLDVPRDVATRVIRVQSRMFHCALFDSSH